MAIRKSSSSPGASHRVPSRSAPLDGRLAVEFANTAHPSAGNQDPLRSWEGLLAFLSGTGVISSDRFRNLLEWEHASAPAIQQLLQAAVRLRTAVREALLAVADGGTTRESLISPINEILAITEGHDELMYEAGNWQLKFRAREESLEWLLAAIARSAAEIIAEGSRAPLRRCANPACGLLIYDTSRTRRRRWCSMALCGNRSKVAAFARRHHPSSSSQA